MDQVKKLSAKANGSTNEIQELGKAILCASKAYAYWNKNKMSEIGPLSYLFISLSSLHWFMFKVRISTRSAK